MTKKSKQYNQSETLSNCLDVVNDLTLKTALARNVLKMLSEKFEDNNYDDDKNNVFYVLTSVIHQLIDIENLADELDYGISTIKAKAV